MLNHSSLKLHAKLGLLAFSMVVWPVFAQTSSDSAQPAAERLADTYSASVGSLADARTLVGAMRAGKDVTLGASTTTSGGTTTTSGGTTVSGTGKNMGYGNIDIALSLAAAQVGPGAASKDFLAALDKVADMRAAGMGWGGIAKSLGLNLGQVMSGSKSNAAAAKSAPAANASKGSGSAKSETVAKADAKSDGPGKSGVQGQGGASASGAHGNSGNAGGNAGGNGGGGGGGGGGGRK